MDNATVVRRALQSNRYAKTTPNYVSPCALHLERHHLCLGSLVIKTESPDGIINQCAPLGRGTTFQEVIMISIKIVMLLCVLSTVLWVIFGLSFAKISASSKINGYKRIGEHPITIFIWPIFLLFSIFDDEKFK